MANGLKTANLFDVPYWDLNDPVKVDILVRKEGDSRPDTFYGLLYEVTPTKMTVCYLEANKERKLDYITIDAVNNNEIEVTNLAPPITNP